MRVYRPTSVPDPVNHELLQAELAGLGNIGVSTDTEGWRIDVFDESITNAQVQAVIDVHDGTQLTDSQKLQQASQIALVQGKAYLRNQLLDPSPDVDSIYTTLRTHADSNTFLQQMVENQLTIDNNAYAWGMTIDPLTISTSLDKQRYIASVQRVIALLT